MYDLHICDSMHIQTKQIGKPQEKQTCFLQRKNAVHFFAKPGQKDCKFVDDDVILKRPITHRRFVNTLLLNEDELIL